MKDVLRWTQTEKKSRREKRTRHAETTFHRCSDNRNPSIGNIGFTFCLLLVYSHYKSACFFLSSASLVSGPYCQVRDYVRARGRGREWTRAAEPVANLSRIREILERSARGTGSIKNWSRRPDIHGDDSVIVTRASHTTLRRDDRPASNRQ